MSKKECRAKNPDNCRMHGTPTATVEALQEQADAATAAGDGATYLALRSQIDELKRPKISDSTVGEVMEVSWKGEDGWSGQTEESYRASVKKSLEQASKHIREDKAVNHFAIFAYSKTLWEETTSSPWQDLPMAARTKLLNSGSVAVNIMLKQLK